MARPLRLEFDGATYHVFSRGNNRSPVFQSNRDYQKFLDLLARTTQRFSLKTYAFCLMTNHYHLLLETTRPNLSKAMQYLNSTYTSYFNVVHRQSGHLFQGRYKAILIDKDNYLLELARYIHLNPVKARIVERPTDYQWSSYRQYLEREKRMPWLRCEDILEQFSLETTEAITNFRNFVEDHLEQKINENPLQGVLYQCVLGSRRFVENMKLKMESPKQELSYRKSLISHNPERILDILQQQKVKEEWQDRFRVYFLRRYTDITLKQLCERFGGGHYSRWHYAIKQLEKELEENRELRAQVSEIEREISNFEA